MNDQPVFSRATTRRRFLATSGGVSLAVAFAPGALASAPPTVNLAPFAAASASFSSTRRKVRALRVLAAESHAFGPARAAIV